VADGRVRHGFGEHGHGKTPPPPRSVAYRGRGLVTRICALRCMAALWQNRFVKQTHARERSAKDVERRGRIRQDGRENIAALNICALRCNSAACGISSHSLYRRTGQVPRHAAVTRHVRAEKHTARPQASCRGAPHRRRHSAISLYTILPLQLPAFTYSPLSLLPCLRTADVRHERMGGRAGAATFLRLYGARAAWRPRYRSYELLMLACCVFSPRPSVISRTHIAGMDIHGDVVCGARGDIVTSLSPFLIYGV